MPTRSRSNPLALAVLISLYERPMHPYEVATQLRQRQKHETVRLNYGSLYGVVESLERRGLIEAQDTERAWLPERTVYRLTTAGRVEMRDWLTELISTPVNDYPAFQAGLSFLPAMPPDDAVMLLRERAQRIEMELIQAAAIREMAEKQRLPRLIWVEAEFGMVLRQAELEYVRRLADDIESGALEGTDWWRAVQTARPSGTIPPLIPEDPGRLPEDSGRLPEDPGHLPEDPGLAEDSGHLPEDPGLAEDSGRLPEDPGLAEDSGRLPEDPGLAEDSGRLPEDPGRLQQDPASAPDPGSTSSRDTS